MSSFRLLSIRAYIYINILIFSASCEETINTNWLLTSDFYSELTKPCQEHLGFITTDNRLTNFDLFIQTNNHLPLTNINDLPSLGNCKQSKTVSSHSMKYCTLHVNVAQINEQLNNITKGDSNRFKRYHHIWSNNAWIGFCLPTQCTKQDGYVLQNAFQIVPQATKHTQTESIEGNNVFDYSVRDIICDEYQSSKVNFALWFFLLYSCCVLVINIVMLFEKPNIKNNYTQIMECFNLKTALINLLSVRTSTHFEVIHGFRLLSTLWVIYGHVHEVNMQFPCSDITHIYEWTKSYQSVFVLMAPMAVDQFITITGFLTGYKAESFVKSFKQRIFGVILPMYPLIFLFHTSLKDFKESPMWWSVSRHLERTCGSHWWASYLLIQNYYNPDAMCAGHTWYIAMDFQLFLLRPLMQYAFQVSYKMTTVLITCAALLLCFWASFVAFGLDLEPTPHSWLSDYFANIYFATHFRSPVWLFSLLIGYSYKEEIYVKCKLSRKCQTCFCVLIMYSIVMFTIYAPYYDVSTCIKAGFTGFHRVLWSLMVLWLIIVCNENKNGLVHRFLSLKILIVLSRLSYCIYLTHPVVQLVVIGSRNGPFQFGMMSNNLDCIQQIFYTLLASLYWYLFVQSVIISIGCLVDISRIDISVHKTK